MIYYKLCFTTNNQYHSAVAERYKVEYKLNEWIYPKIGKLFVFDDLDCLNKFAQNISTPSILTERFAVFSCEVKNPQPCTIICFIENDIATFWKRQSVCQFITNPPEGTIQCDAVKLLERL